MAIKRLQECRQGDIAFYQIMMYDDTHPELIKEVMNARSEIRMLGLVKIARTKYKKVKIMAMKADNDYYTVLAEILT